jgi:membrane protein GlpM
MTLILKALIGAIVVVIIDLLARTKNFYIAGLVPLFPTFALITHYIVGTQRPVADLRQVVVFGFCAIIPYSIYLLAIYVLAGRMKLFTLLGSATLLWLLAAIVLIALWQRR